MDLHPEEQHGKQVATPLMIATEMDSMDSKMELSLSMDGKVHVDVIVDQMIPV